MSRCLLVLVLRALRGGLVAAAVMLLPPLLWPSLDARLTGYAGLLIVLLSIQAGLRTLASLGGLGTLGRRLGFGGLFALIESLVVSLALYLLYAWLRPELLAARYASMSAKVAAGSPAQVTERLTALAAGRAQALDPLFQAVEGGVTILFAALLLVAYLGIRAQVLSRLKVGRPRAP